jgi:hypothetical protein
MLEIDCRNLSGKEMMLKLHQFMLKAEVGDGAVLLINHPHEDAFQSYAQLFGCDIQVKKNVGRGYSVFIVKCSIVS